MLRRRRARKMPTMPSTAARALAVVVLGAAAAPAAAVGAPPSPGAPGVGDRLFPTLGNGGYDVGHYDLTLRYDVAQDGGQAITGTVRARARATQALSRFDLDFAGDAAGEVRVDGQPAGAVRDGEELVVTPARPLRAGQAFTVEVRGFATHATIPNPEDPASTAVFLTPDGSAMAPQPAGAHRLFPSNDHPSDKATFTFVLDAPAGLTAVANGVPSGSESAGDRVRRRYVVRRPMATALTQVAVGRYDVTRHPDAGRVHLRDVTSPRFTEALRPRLGLAPEHLAWLQARLGRFPQDVYGALVLDLPVPLALETSTLTVFDASSILDPPPALAEPHLVHELSHAWYGGTVSPEAWSDVWLSEGHAYRIQVLFAADHGQLEGQTGFDSMDAFWTGVHELSDAFRAEFGPVALPHGGRFDQLFSPNAYLGGALVLEALRRHVGDRTFDRIEREWLRRFAGRSASTADFVALASEVSGADQSGFLEPWLYDEQTPPLPSS
jgi:aminopeptidase N